MALNSIGNYFDDFSNGQVIEHQLSKTIFESDNNLFSLITMNFHPVHTNVDYAEKNQHGKILVVGTLVFSLAVGITVPDISGKAIANLEYESVKHLGPVFIGDTIYARTKVLECITVKSKNDRGIIKVETTVFNQKNEDVLIFVRKVLLKKKNHGN